MTATPRISNDVTETRRPSRDVESHVRDKRVTLPTPDEMTISNITHIG